MSLSQRQVGLVSGQIEHRHGSSLSAKGTANFGILDVRLPEKSILLNQVLWGSIGWAAGECRLFNGTWSPS